MQQSNVVKYEYFLLSNKALFTKSINFLVQLETFVEAGVISKEDIEILLELTALREIPGKQENAENTVVSGLMSTLTEAFFHMICRKTREKKSRYCVDLLISGLVIRSTRQHLARKLRKWQ